MLPSVDSRLACLVILLLISTASPVSVLLWIVLRSFFPPASTETERQFISQDIKTSQAEWWRTRFCTSPNTRLRCDSWCVVDRDGVIWRSRHTWFCSHRMERIQQFLVLDALHLYLAYSHAIVSVTHDAGWFDVTGYAGALNQNKAWHDQTPQPVSASSELNNSQPS